MQVSLRWWQLAACCFLISNLLFASASAAGTEPTVAASFDCAKASGVDTDIICSDPLLRHADGELGRLYRQLIAEAGGQARVDALKNDERTWILRRNSQCEVSKSLKLNNDQLPNYVDCFLAAYDERMDDLRRMRADPQADPATVSNPIRKSSFGDTVTDIAIPAGALSETGLVTADGGTPVLAFRGDSSLVVLGSKEDQSDIGLYIFKAGVVEETISAASPLPSTAGLCVTAKTILVRRSAAEPTLQMASQDKLEPLAAGGLSAELRRSCTQWGDRAQAGEPNGNFALDLGPRSAGNAESARFVTLIDAQGGHALIPPIRIDRRYPPIAHFNQGDGKFVVNAGPRPQDARTIADRVWAKTNCGVFWEVDPATRRTTSACIPFGSYVDEANPAVTVALPTRAGLYFSIESRGLFKVVDGVGKRVVTAPVGQPQVAPDGCSIAFIGSPGKGSPLRRVMILNACKVQ